MTNPRHEALVEAVARAVEVADESYAATYPGDPFVARAGPGWAKAIAIAALSATAATPSEEVVRLREIVFNVPVSAMVGRCGWKDHREALVGLRAALEPQAKDL